MLFWINYLFYPELYEIFISMLFDIYINIPLMRQSTTFSWITYFPFITDLAIFAWICVTAIAFSIIIDPDPDDDEEKERKKRHRDSAMRKFYYSTGALIAVLGISALSKSPEVFFKLVKEINIIHDVIFDNIGEYINYLDSGSLDFSAINYNKLEIYSIKELCDILEAFGDGTIPKNNSNYHKVFMQIIKLKGESMP